jgi:hypothetical protein
MTIPPLVLIVAGIAAVIFAMYRVQGASVLILAAAICAISWGAVKYDTSALPVPPGPGPNPPPTPGPGPVPPPNPTGFAANVRTAFKADGGNRGLAITLGAMSERLGQEIAANPTSFKDAADIGAKWELYRGTIFQPMGKWCPKTNEVLAAERERRGLQSGPITDHAKHAKLWDEFGKALLAYE